ncbi:hypothetical protein [Shewanella sp. UCD-KL12]|uniref:hypothetical protein n=1 Tax=Shewanella sp. UCD-KL12 TaxID=1917163 RepID=UPI000970D728|nr:hypothetical protein [Shewanella sp. UCD-KL12]
MKSRASVPQKYLHVGLLQAINTNEALVLSKLTSIKPARYPQKATCYLLAGKLQVAGKFQAADKVRN